MFDQWIKKLEPYFTTKAPFQLPVKAKEWIVNYSRIISLVLAVLLVPAMLALLTLFGWVGAVAGVYGVVVSPLYWLAGLSLVIPECVFEAERIFMKCFSEAERF